MIFPLCPICRAIKGILHLKKLREKSIHAYFGAENTF
jgi:hypothetical protein